MNKQKGLWLLYRLTTSPGGRASACDTILKWRACGIPISEPVFSTHFFFSSSSATAAELEEEDIVTEGNHGSRPVWNHHAQLRKAGNNNNNNNNTNNNNSSNNKELSEIQPALVDFLDASIVYQSLAASKVSGNMPKGDREKLIAIFKQFESRGWARDQAIGLYIRSSLFPSAVGKFRRFFLHHCTREIRAHLLGLGQSAASDAFLFTLFAEFCLHDYRCEMEQYRALVNSADLTKPHTWYPFARAMRRKIIYHCGPTNSGKTYNALQSLVRAPTGIYCGPLRLLAMEVFERVNSEGVYCSLLTGQEKKEVPFGTHLSCTVETAPVNQLWDVAVIDEVQMISDEFRGCAWTRALLGLQATEIHVCGDPSPLPLIRNICAATGDILEEAYYDRFKPLTVDEQSLNGDVKNVQPGDCIVAFTRKDIFRLKECIEQYTEHRCCVVYGSLPPETRSEQARVFNDPTSGYDILVASDAVGMGLNLNIRRVIFYSVEKFNGDQTALIPASSIKQIAGRAGRRGSLFPEGRVTTFYPADLPYMKDCLKAPYGDAQAAGLFPAYEQLELFAGQLPDPDVTLSQLFERFAATCRLDGSYFLCRTDHIQLISDHLGKVRGLTLEERFHFCFAPVNLKDMACMDALLQFAEAYSNKEPIRIPLYEPSGFARTDRELLEFETRYKIASLYLWLSQHLTEEYFIERDKAVYLLDKIALVLGESLARKLGSSRRQALTFREILGALKQSTETVALRKRIQSRAALAA